MERKTYNEIHLGTRHIWKSSHISVKTGEVSAFIKPYQASRWSDVNLNEDGMSVSYDVKVSEVRYLVGVEDWGIRTLNHTSFAKTLAVITVGRCLWNVVRSNRSLLVQKVLPPDYL